jgi:hypothetical protein
MTHGLVGVFLAMAVLLFNSPAAHADQRDFTLVNNTGQIITHVFVSSSDLTDWGDDVLGRDVLDDQDTVFIYFKKFSAGSCLYDIKVITDSGDEGQLNQVNLCNVDTVTFN